MATADSETLATKVVLESDCVQDALRVAGLWPQMDRFFKDQPEPFQRLWRGHDLNRDMILPGVGYGHGIWPDWNWATLRGRIRKICQVVGSDGWAFGPDERDVIRIESDPLRLAVQLVLQAAPLEWWVCPASSSGKYHPRHQNTPGGLLAHVLEMLLRLPRLLSAVTEDLFPWQGALDWARAAALIHDTFKCVDETGVWIGYTTDSHPESAAQAWCLAAWQVGLEAVERDAVLEAVQYHSGRWTPGIASWNELSPLGLVVHLCDMVCSDSPAVQEMIGPVML